MVRMKVKVVGLDQNSMVPVVVITDYEEKGFIPIMIGVWEATAISQGLEGQKLARPMTHDLLKNVLDTLKAKIDRILIHCTTRILLLKKNTISTTRTKSTMSIAALALTVSQ
jgi:bifunctional DNase/RNase